MSQIAIKGATTGTGVFTLESPATNTDRTLILPDEAGTVLTSASDVAASQITTALNATGSAPIYAARAWVNFNGTGTVAIRAAGNVSSITDNGVGDYTVNFTTAMPDANYATTFGSSGNDAASVNYALGINSRLSGSVRVLHQNGNGGQEDLAENAVAIFR